jgi:hypothetical protein
MKISSILFLVFLMGMSTYADNSLSAGSGSYLFSDRSKTVRVWYHCPDKLTPTTPVCFVMHGRNRKGQKYRDSWVEYAEKNQFLLLVPEFDETNFPKSYNTGNIFDEDGSYNNPKYWTYTLIDKIFDGVVDEHDLLIKQYSIYGYSAGAQFVHRLAIFCPNAKFKVAIAANAGWYTFLDNDIEFPYGIDGAKVSKKQVKDALGKELILLLGTEDINPNHKYLRNTREARAQGDHRFARGQKYYAHAYGLAEKYKTPFNWKLIPVPGVAHSNAGMSKEAAKYIK